MRQSFCRRVLAGAFPARLGRLKRSLTAWCLGVALVIVSALGSAPVAAAASSWWIPSTWIVAAVGTVAGAADALTGDVSGAAPPAGVRVEQDLNYNGGGGTDLYKWQAEGMVLYRVWYACSGGSCRGDWGTHDVVDPSTVGQSQASGNAVCTKPDGHDELRPVVLSMGTWPLDICGSGTFVRLGMPGGSDWGHRFVDASIYVGSLSPDPIITSVTCRSASTGHDTVRTESSTSGVASAPVCPAGSYSVRVRVTQGDEVLQDASISAGASPGAEDYLTSPGDWELVPTPGGDSPCALTPRDGTMALSAIPLNQAMCDEGGSGGTGEELPQPQECGADPVCLAVGVAVQAVNLVKQAVDRVKNAVDAVKNAINKGIAGIKSTIQSTVDRIIEAIQAVERAIVQGVVDLGKLIQELIDKPGDPGPGTGTGGCTSSSCGGVTPGGGPGPGVGDGWSDLGEKFSPITDGLDDLGRAFNPPATGDCKGPGVPLGLNGELSYPLDACAEPMRGVAGIAKMACGVMMMLGAAMAIVRVLASSFGMTVDLGRGE